MLQSFRDLAQWRQYSVLKAELLNQGASNPELRSLLAFAHAALGETEAALSLLAQDVSEALDSLASVDCAGALIILGQLPAAEVLLQEVIKRDPGCALAHARLAYAAELRGDNPQAEISYQTAWKIDSTRISVGVNYSIVLRLNGHLKEAQQVIDECRTRLTSEMHLLPKWVSQTTHTLDAVQLAVWIDTGEIKRAEDWLATLPTDTGEKSAWFKWTLQFAVLLAQQDRVPDSENVLRQVLTQLPDNIQVMLRLGALAQLNGNAGVAAGWVRRALKIKPDDVSLWAALCSYYLPHQLTLAREAADKALALADKLAIDLVEGGEAEARVAKMQAQLALAEVLFELKDFDSAEALFRTILEDLPHHTPTLRIFGQMQLQRGRIDEALQLFEQVKRLDPVSGLSSLINARHFPQDTETVERLELAARRPSLNGSVRAGLLFQVAAAWEKHKDHARAFDCARQANETSKKYLQYDPRAHRDRCARVRARFSSAFFAHRREIGSTDTLPVFVVGMPRSGTTLVEQILAGHTQVFGAGELGTLPQVIAGLEQWERMIGSGRGYPDCVDDLDAEVAAGITQKILSELRDFDPDARYVVDKLPHNFENIGLIKLLMPKAKIISVRRDPRDIAISNYFIDYQAKHGGMGFAYDLSWIGEQLADHNLLMHHWDAVFPGEILEIQYEDLVANPEALARRMLDYLDLPWESEVLNTSELDRPVKTASVWQVRQPIYQTSKAKWMNYRTFLSPLIAATNARIEQDPIADMVTLPQPSWLSEGIRFFKEGQLDDAEHCFKKLCSHIPEHAAANFMTGLIYLCKGHISEGIVLMEMAHRTNPGNRKWMADLARAYTLAGRDSEALALQEKLAQFTRRKPEHQEVLTALAGESVNPGFTEIDGKDIPWLATGGRS